jgi:hypothetical protein
MGARGLVSYSFLLMACCAASLTQQTDNLPGLDSTDCQILCPRSADRGEAILPAITQIQKDSGDWENVLECWSVKTVTPEMPDVGNAFRLDWEEGFDAVYQYAFDGPSFMPSHPAPEPSLIIMSSGIGEFKQDTPPCYTIQT